MRIHRRSVFARELERIVALETPLSNFDAGNILAESLLFQSGYLTVDSVHYIPCFTQSVLRYPNLEIQTALNRAFLSALTGETVKYSLHANQLYELLMTDDFAGLRALLQSFYASIPHRWYTGNAIAQYEGFYVSVFYSYFAALGLDIRTEESTDHGCIDMAVVFGGQVYLFEFKVVEKTPEGKAIQHQQLRDMGYAGKYRTLGCPIHLVGIEFSKTEHNIMGFEVETI